MKALFHLGHPAHFHLFKNVIVTLNSKGHQIFILIKKKDIASGTRLLSISQTMHFDINKMYILIVKAVKKTITKFK